MKQNLVFSLPILVVVLGLQTSIADHNHDNTHHHHSAAQEGIFEDSDVKDRLLSDWEGNWQSVYPYLVNGDLDKVLVIKAEKGDKTVEAYKDYYLKGYQSDLTHIEINHNEITFHAPNQDSSCQYLYSGRKILNYQSGKRGVRYLFECTDANSTAPKYIQFSDHIIAPEKAEHFHIYMGNNSHEQLLVELTNWPTFYPALLSKEEIVEEMVGHDTHHGAHQHGVAKMNISIEDHKVELELLGALANFITFEYAPKSDAELTEVKEMVKILNNTNQLFVLSKKANCTLDHLILTSDVIDNQLLNSPGIKNQYTHSHSDHATHGNLSTAIEWSCDNPAALNQLEVLLFKSFPHLEHLEVQMITPKGQKAVELSPQETTIKW